MSAIVLSWMLTYLLHSTLLLGGAWLAWRLLPEEALGIKETLWRAALIGGLVTASLQTGAGVEPRAGAWSLGEGAETARIEAPQFEPATSEPAGFEATTVAPRPDSVEVAGLSRPDSFSQTRRPLPVATELADSLSAAERAATASPGWQAWLVRAWAVGALALVGWLAASFLALARRLADRRRVESGGLFSLLAGLEKTEPVPRVGLSASGRICSPLAFGLRHREICLPDRVASEMVEEQQELVLAHELAHHTRRDPAWLIVLRLIESVFFFQPLNRLARRRLQEIAEYRCDDWAVERTGRPVTLARCLADVAEWNLRQSARLPVPSLAVERRRLGRRVARLLDRSYPFPSPARPKWLAATIAATLVLVVLVVPGVSNGHTEPPEPERAPTVPEAPEAPPAAEAPLAPFADLDSPPMPPAAPRAPLVVAPSAPLVVAPSAPPVVAPSPAAPAIAPALAPVAPVHGVAPTPATRVSPRSPRVAPSPPVAPVLAVPVAPSALVRPALAPMPPGVSVGIAPALPGRLRAVPAPPAPPSVPAPSSEGEEWVIHEGSWPESDLVPLAEVNDLLADTSVEVARMSAAISSMLAAEEWVQVAESMALAAEARPSPEELARLAAFGRRLEELSESSPEASGRLATAYRPDPEALARIERLSSETVARSQMDPVAMDRIAAMARELSERALPDTEARALYEAYAHRLRAEIRREIEASRPDREEMARAREEIRRELEAARPDLEEMARLREELRAEIERLRAELERLRGDGDGDGDGD